MVILLISSLSAFGGGQKEETGKTLEPVTIEVSDRHSEYHAQFRQVWDLYEEENPHVKVELFHVNEDTTKLFEARVASGDPPDMCVETHVNQFSYKNFIDLNTIGYEHFDKWPFDYAAQYKQLLGIEDYIPVIGPFAGYNLTFVYYRDEMDKAGLNPRESVRTVQDLKEFLYNLKAYVDSRSDLEYVWDTGYHAGMWSDQYFLALFAGMFGAEIGKDDVELYFGRKRWDIKSDNIYVPVLELMKELTGDGILPSNWPSRQWEQDFENSFISRKSIFCFHGPWIWNKVFASDPDAQLTGFPIPANKDGIVHGGEPNWKYGGGIFTDGQSRPHAEETIRAFKWYFSPQTVKIVAEALGQDPIMDVSSAGEVNLQIPQFKEVIGPEKTGYFGKRKLIAPFRGMSYAQQYLKKGKPMVVKDPMQAKYYTDYLTGIMSLQEMIDIWQRKWEDSYDLSM